jgi:hypothetical protein
MKNSQGVTISSLNSSEGVMTLWDSSQVDTEAIFFSNNLILCVL